MLNLYFLLTDFFIEDPPQRKEKRMNSTTSLALYSIAEINVVVWCGKLTSQFLGPFRQYPQNLRGLDGQLLGLNLFGAILFIVLGNFPSNSKVSILLHSTAIILFLNSYLRRILHISVISNTNLLHSRFRLHISISHKL
jgi:hypothetical protein